VVVRFRYMANVKAQPPLLAVGWSELLAI